VFFSSQSDAPRASYGWCPQCNNEHRLEEGNAHEQALLLMRELEDLRRIDFHCDPADADPRFSTDYLFGEARGQMFGVLTCVDGKGAPVVLRAFSCQYNAAWTVEGWAPPLFDVEAYEKIMARGDEEIKMLGRVLDGMKPGTNEHHLIKDQRKRLSRTVMKELHGLYELQNFAGQTMPLTEFYKDMKGIPTGAGDCCAPKLLNHAARNNLRPLGLAEFYWGKPNRSESRKHGRFYSSCPDKCQPILGFLLCGARS
jgi:hypothetical protein